MRIAGRNTILYWWKLSHLMSIARNQIDRNGVSMNGSCESEVWRMSGEKCTDQLDKIV